MHCLAELLRKKEKKKGLQIFCSGSLRGFLCTVIKFCGSNLYPCFCFIFGFLEDLENLGQIY